MDEHAPLVDYLVPVVCAVLSVPQACSRGPATGHQGCGTLAGTWSGTVRMTDKVLGPPSELAPVVLDMAGSPLVEDEVCTVHDIRSAACTTVEQT